eukprot:1137818-Pelagomonas_calceolata.AAC.1
MRVHRQARKPNLTCRRSGHPTWQAHVSPADVRLISSVDICCNWNDIQRIAWPLCCVQADRIRLGTENHFTAIHSGAAWMALTGGGSETTIKDIRAPLTRDHLLCQGHVVVGDEVHAQQVLGIGVAVQLVAHLVDQTHDALGNVIG